MKIVILAMDGLEYELVVKYRLKYLMQKVYGYVDVSDYYINEVGDILTTAIWASFITGEPPNRHGINRLWISRSKLIDILVLKRDKLIPKILRPILSTVARKLHVVEPPSKRHLRMRGLKTIFDEVKSYVIDFPAYNESMSTRERLIRASRRGLSEYANEVWKLNKERVRKFINVLKHSNDYMLYAVWLDLADKIGHIYLPKKRKLEVMKAYFWLNSVAYKVNKLINPETDILIIVSDHGMNIDGSHSPRAFYSFSKNLNFKPKSITDFCNLVKNLIEES